VSEDDSVTIHSNGVLVSAQVLISQSLGVLQVFENYQQKSFFILGFFGNEVLAIFFPWSGDFFSSLTRARS